MCIISKTQIYYVIICQKCNNHKNECNNNVLIYIVYNIYKYKLTFFSNFLLFPFLIISFHVYIICLNMYIY